MSFDLSIQLGVPDDQVSTATKLYCTALREKLQPFLGTPERAANFLARGLARDRAFVALHEGQVVGIAGFKVNRTGLFGPSMVQFFSEYGITAPLRILGLGLLERKEEPNCLLMDGIAVSRAVRGKGIGTRLLQAIDDHARSLGKTSIRLDVIDTNPGARRLYERFGFIAGRTSGIGPLCVLFSFRHSTKMTKQIG